MSTFDVIVAGGGPAGCVLAARLSEDPQRTVCLIEAGPDYGPRSGARWPEELLDPTTIPDSHDWRDPEASLPWARVIGGCSAHNACAVTRGPAADYDAWQHSGGTTWSWAALEPCFERARMAIGAMARDAPDVGSWHAAVVEAAVEAGLPRLIDLDAERSGAGIAATNVVHGARHNAAFAYLDAARGRPNLTVLGGTLVVRVLLSRDRATGVQVRGPTGAESIGGELVILAAGAYGSPAILLRSGVGPEKELRAHGIRPAHVLPGVGASLADHPRAGIGFSLQDDAARALQGESGDRAIVAQCIAKWASAHADGAWDTHLLAIVPPDRRTARLTAGLVAPRSRGRVGLRSTDATQLPRVEHRFLSDEEGRDRAALEEAVGFLRGLTATSALSAAVTGEVDPGPEVDLAAHVATTVTTYYHPTGTCAMRSAGDREAVVDARCAVVGLAGLHVGDASVIPEPVRAGTHLTVLAVAERVAELMNGDRRRSREAPGSSAR